MPGKVDNIDNFNQEANQSGQGFYGLGIAPRILGILECIKFEVPMPIQIKAIPRFKTPGDLSGTFYTHPS